MLLLSPVSTTPKTYLDMSVHFNTVLFYRFIRTQFTFQVYQVGVKLSLKVNTESEASASQHI